MRDRLKRPKKNAETSKSGPAQAPLQPAYYDAPENSPAAPPKLAQPETAEPEMEARPAPDRQPDLEEPEAAHAAPSQRPSGKQRPAPSTATGKRWPGPRWIPGCKNRARRRDIGQTARERMSHRRLRRRTKYLARARRRQLLLGLRRARSFSPSGCRVRAKVPGSSGTTSRRFRATCCGRFCSTIPRNSAFRT